MNRLSVIVWVVLLGMIAGTALAQDPPGPPPDIKVSLALDKTSYGPDEPIMVTLALENLGTADIITSEGFSDTEFYLLLQFFDESDTLITSDQLGDASTVTPAPPRVFVDAGVLLQGELIEILPQSWVAAYDPFDANTYYPLGNASGLLRVKAVVTLRTYATYLETAAGVKYAQLYPTDAAQWWGSVQSNFASFTRVGDADGDGYYYPQAYGQYPQADCDDKNAAVHPGADEILNNGIDDDCDPLTPDAGAVVTTGTIAVTVEKHTTGKGGSKEPLEGVAVHAYDKTADSCAKGIGMSKKKYPTIWDECSADASGTTDAEGKVDLSVAPAEYLLIAQCVPDACDSETFVGGGADPVEVDQTVTKYLQIIVKKKKR